MPRLAPLALAVAIALSAAAEAETPKAATETPQYGGGAFQPAPVQNVTELRCGDVTARFRVDADGAVLEVDGRAYRLVETVSASGARYEAEGDPTTVFWSHGTEALLQIAGVELPTCTVAEEPAPGSATLEGEWTVQSIGGTPVLEEAPRATLAFTADGQVTGRGSCNQYTAAYTVDGEAITIGPDIAFTQMACAPEILEQERRFLDALAAATAFAVDEGGTLTLSGGEEIVATRGQPAE